ncbi:hypothetical protein F5050DRAFT_1751338 [Lentinula boryana]|uniref:Metallothionein n=1 Tax=Lentinula boryana TaxID=40481 RepID=A0ABQ8QGA8_9AGAR|nr:hypothetical protein F5050DRAFT_1751338 [Lentinula boryana]
MSRFSPTHQFHPLCANHTNLTIPVIQMYTTTQTPVSQANCGSSSCGCGATCGCKPGECKC